MSGGGVVVALNGALQKRFVFPADTPLIPGNVHRIREVQSGIGGKGQDVAIALSCLGYAREKLKIAQFLGMGTEGDQVYKMMEERTGTEAMSLTVRPESKLRTCTSVVASDTTTELIEPSGKIQPEEMAELLAKISDVEGGTAASVCIMGSMPPGCPEYSYARIYERSAGPDTRCVIDSLAGLKPLLETIATRKGEIGNTIFKVNASELCKLAGVEKKNNEIDGIGVEELIAAVTAFLAKFNPSATEALAAVAITDGSHPSYLAVLSGQGFDVYQILVPSLSKGRTLFPIGAGDAVAAGILASWQCLFETACSSDSVCLPPNLQDALKSHMEGLDVSAERSVRAMITSLSFGVACGSASCLEEENSVLKTGDVLSLFRETHPTLVSSHSL